MDMTKRNELFDEIFAVLGSVDKHHDLENIISGGEYTSKLTLFNSIIHELESSGWVDKYEISKNEGLYKFNFDGWQIFNTFKTYSSWYLAQRKAEASFIKEDIETSKLEKENLILQNESLEYHKTIRDLDEEIKTLQKNHLKNYFFVGLVLAVISAFLTFLAMS